MLLWAAVEPLLPSPTIGPIRWAVIDRGSRIACVSAGILIRLVTGASWVDIEAILDHQVSDTTLRARRDEWIDAGVFDRLKQRSDPPRSTGSSASISTMVALDGSLHKAPYGGEGTGPNPVTGPSSAGSGRRVCERHGVPIGWAIDGANRNDVAHARTHPRRHRRPDCSSTSAPCTLDRGYDSPRRACSSRAPAASTSSTSNAAAPSIPGVKNQPVRLGLRWIVEATNTWWSNYGQLRRSTDRRTATDTPRCASPPSSSSSDNSSPAATDGAQVEPYPLGSLGRDRRCPALGRGFVVPGIGKLTLS